MNAIESECECDTRQLGANIAMILQKGDMIALSGDLGAGKSVLSRAIIQALAGDPCMEVSSPTYTLCNLYETFPRVAHYDLYRLASPAETDELGIDDALETGCVLVEWPENGYNTLPPEAVHINITFGEGNKRTLCMKGKNELLERIDRSFYIRKFLDINGFSGAERIRFPPDASARRYERICSEPGKRYYLMDSPAVSHDEQIGNEKSYTQIAHIAQNTTRPFMAIGHLLTSRGLGAPKICAADIANGLLLVEDMGEELVIDTEQRPVRERYFTATQYIANFHNQKFDPVCELPDGTIYQIAEYDRDAMMAEVGLLLEWYIPAYSHQSLKTVQIDRFHHIWSALIDRLDNAERSLVLRDFHSVNIIWRAQFEGIERIGVIDFQDAVLGPSAYDLASLIQDARTHVSVKLQQELLDHYIALRKHGNAGFDANRFREALAIMAAQRATKILGLFVRLNKREGKPKYLSYIPVIKSYLAQSVAHPVLSDYRQWLKSVIKL